MWRGKESLVEIYISVATREVHINIIIISRRMKINHFNVESEWSYPKNIEALKIGGTKNRKAKR